MGISWHVPCLYRGMGKTLEKIRSDPRVSEVYADSDGVWIYLRNGWGNGNPQEHIIVEDTVTEAYRKMRNILPCSCEQCTSA